MNWSSVDPIKKGDVFTVAGKYKRRTLWEWLTRKQRELQRFLVTNEVTTDGIAETRQALQEFGTLLKHVKRINPPPDDYDQPTLRRSSKEEA